MYNALYVDKVAEERATSGWWRALCRSLQAHSRFVFYRDPPFGRTSVEKQLRRRDHFPQDAWDGFDISVVTGVCSIIRREVGWPNAHYIPADPLCLLFCGYDRDDVYTIYELDDQFCLGLEDKAGYASDVRHWLLGSLITDVIHRSGKRDAPR